MFHKIRYLRAKFLDKQVRYRKLKSPHVCIISNNCWGSMAFYQRFSIQYNTPTVGLFISDHDFMKFCSNLRYYLSLDLRFIRAQDSPAFAEVRTWPIGNNSLEDYSFPVAMINDVTIWFMHAKTNGEALIKWNRRKGRVDFDNIVIKWSQRYTDSEEVVKQFLSLPYTKKFGIVDAKCPIDSPELIKLEGWNDLRNCGGDEIGWTSSKINTIKILNSLC